MIYFTFLENMKGIFYSLVFGILCALLYLIMIKAPVYMTRLLTAAKMTFRRQTINISELRDRFEEVEKSCSIPSFKAELLNFVHITVCSTLYCILLYIAFDGIFRLISLLAVLSAFFIFRRLFFKTADKTVDKILLYFIYTTVLLLHIMLKPIFVLCIFILDKHIKPRIEKKILKRSLKTHLNEQNKKYRELSELIR